jgi:DNA-binding NtrC family response regulator
MSSCEAETIEITSPASWFQDATARDPVLGRLYPQLKDLAAGDAPVLLVGEPGSAREPAARAIHNLSGRAARPFATMDCSASSERLLEAELFGVDDGVSPRKLGIFEQAHGGTVLLTEIAELPMRLQLKILRLLERQEIVRLGATAPVTADVRLLTTSTIDLRQRAAGGLVSHDLFDHLNTRVLPLPPLRERKDDVGPLARHFLEQCCRGLPQRPLAFTDEAEAVLRGYDWPGNLRELRRTVDEAVLATRGEYIGPDELPVSVRGTERTAGLSSLEDVEMHHIRHILAGTHGNQRQAARILGITRWSLARRLRKYGLLPKAAANGHTGD